MTDKTPTPPRVTTLVPGVCLPSPLESSHTSSSPRTPSCRSSPRTRSSKLGRSGSALCTCNVGVVAGGSVACSGLASIDCCRAMGKVRASTIAAIHRSATEELVGSTSNTGSTRSRVPSSSAQDSVKWRPSGGIVNSGSLAVSACDCWIYSHIPQGELSNERTNEAGNPQHSHPPQKKKPTCTDDTLSSSTLRVSGVRGAKYSSTIVQNRPGGWLAMLRAAFSSSVDVYAASS